MTNQQTLNQLGFGQYDIQYIKINSRRGVFDISNMLLNFEIYQSIHEYSITVNLMIQDARDLLNNLDLRGDEFVTIAFSDNSNNGFPSFMSMQLDAINDRVGHGSDTYYTLSLISPKSELNSKMMTSRSYTGTATDIIRNIVSSELNTGITIHSNAVGIINDRLFEYSTPFSKIDKLIRDAYDKDNYPIFVYDTLYGLQAKSYKRMFDEQPKAYFVYSENTDNTNGKTKIQNYQFDSVIDRKALKRRGGIQRDVRMINMLNRNCSYTRPIKRSLSQENDLFDSNCRIFVPSLTNDARNHESKIHRGSALFNAPLKIVATLSNYIIPGDTVHVSIPSSEPLESGQSFNPDKKISGKYVVSAVKHSMNPDVGTTTLELVRDGYGR